MKRAAERERYGLPGFVSFPLGGGRELFQFPVTGRLSLLPEHARPLLGLCHTFRTLEEHATAVRGRNGMPEDMLPRIREALEILRSAGGLVSYRTVLRKCRGRSRETRERSESIGVPTCDRPASLERTLRSCVQNMRRFGRSAELVVVDDSTGAAARKKNQQVATAVAAESGMPVRYSGVQDRQALCFDLKRRDVAPPELLEFAIAGNRRGGWMTTGAARNALLLHTVGQLTIQLDDDMLAEVARVRDREEGLRLCSKADPTEFWFGEAVVLQAAAPQDADGDFLGRHEDLLGRDVGACLRETPELVDLDEVGLVALRKLDGSMGTVVTSALGFVGDSGVEWPGALLLFLDSRSRHRLMASEEGCREALESRQIVRAVRKATIATTPMCASGNLGLDNRVLLPPFLPVHRSEDAVFGLTLEICFKEAFMGFLPWTIRHRPPEERRVSLAEVWTSAGRLRIPDILRLIIASFDGLRGRLPGAEGLRVLGAQLAAFGRMPAGDFAEVIAILQRRAVTSYVLRLEGQLAEERDLPKFWVEHLKRYIVGLQKTAASDACGSLGDAPMKRDAAGAVRPFQDLVLSLGRLYQHWPDIVAGAQSLRGQERSLPPLVGASR